MDPTNNVRFLYNNLTNKLNEFLKLFIYAKNLDIADLNFVFSSSIFPRFLKASPSALPRKGFLIRLSAFLYKFMGLLKPNEWEKEWSIPKSRISFFAISINQRDSILQISKYIDNSIIFGNQNSFPFSYTKFLGYLFSLPFFPLVIINYINSKGIHKLSYLYNFDQYWLTYGYYIAVRLWLKKITPEMLIFANDHVMECRVMVKAARDEGIRTAYIQHASVTNEFPRLNFDYAFLEGEDALSMYCSAGDTNTIVFLVGSPKYDSYCNYSNKNTFVQSLGICTNSLDPVQVVDDLCSSIKDHFPDLSLFLRPHPGDKRKPKWMELSRKYGISFSNPSLENSYDFLQKVDCIIAGNSNIHLEAVLMNVYPLFFDFTNHPELIKYSFIEKHLVEYYSKISDLLSKINLLTIMKQNIKNRGKIYNSIIGTPFEGKSGILVAKTLLQLTRNQENNGIYWKKIQNLPILALILSQNDLSL